MTPTTAGMSTRSTAPGQIAADDWLCESDQPVTDIHWWGSFLGWYEPYPPPNGMPTGFYLAIWDDVPAGTGTEDYSHPGTCLWLNWCESYTWEFVGWDFDPRDPYAPPEATFKFTQYLPESEWFWQDTGDNIYWLSIGAVHPDDPPEYPFGWKTRPYFFQDDAVRIWDETCPVTGSAYTSGEPIWWPTEFDSWDLAFELTTRESEPTEACCLPDGTCVDVDYTTCVNQGGFPQGPGTDCTTVVCMALKWAQPPTYNPFTPYPDCFYGWDEWSDWHYGPIVADDFPCEDNRPITDVHWWGSYFYWTDAVPPPGAPPSFHIGLWTDFPGTPFSHPVMLIHEWWVLARRPQRAVHRVRLPPRVHGSARVLLPV